MRLLAAALGSAALAVAGCGGDDKDPAPAGGQAKLSKTQYIAEADDVCRANQRRLEPIERDLTALPTDAEGRGDTKRIEPILKRALAETRSGYERLRALPAPRDDKKTLEHWLTSTERSIEAFAEVLEAVRRDDREAARGPSERVDNLSAEQRALARAYGFKACRSAASTD